MHIGIFVTFETMFFIRLLGKLPLGFLYGLSTFTAFIIHRIIRYRRKVILLNLEHAFPDADPKTRRKILKDFYYRFTDYAVETLKILEMNSEDFKRHTTVSYGPELENIMKEKKSFIILLSHQFNWEWVLHGIQHRLPFSMEAAYQKLSHKGFNNYMIQSRISSGGLVIEKSKLIRHVVKTRNIEKAIILLADQSPRPKAKKFWTTFMNQETAFATGPEVVAKMIGQPVFFLNTKREKRGHYHTQILPVATPPYEKDRFTILESYAKMTEEMIRDDPPGYLWSHRRWKLTREMFPDEPVNT